MTRQKPRHDKKQYTHFSSIAVLHNRTTGRNDKFPQTRQLKILDSEKTKIARTFISKGRMITEKSTYLMSNNELL